MKIVMFKIDGDVSKDDLVILCYRAPRGGRTHVMHRVGEGEDTYDVARSLASSINKDWMTDFFRADVRSPATVRIECQDAVSDVRFDAEIERAPGAKKPAFSLMEV